MIKRWVRTHIVLVLFFLVAFLLMHIYIAFINNNSVTYKMRKNHRTVLSMNVSKSWSEKAHGFVYGMQYDGLIDNYTDSDFSEWTVELEFDGLFYVDSFWNVDLKVNDTGVVLTPELYNGNINSGDKAEFGFILYADTLDAIKSGSITMNRTSKITQLSSFWLLMILLLIVVSIDITVYFVTRKERLQSEELKRRHEESLKIINQSLLLVANMIDAKDTYTQGHSVRVAIYSKEIAKRMGLSDDEQDAIFRIALVHDIGKIGINDSVLKKRGKLLPDERRQIEEHVRIGAEILKDFTAIEGIQDGALYHHERYDGTGYVNGLKGEEIPLYARIIGVADSFDTMSRGRCYSKAMESSTIRDELKECSGTQFDPAISEIMIQLMDDGIAPVKNENLREQLGLAGDI